MTRLRLAPWLALLAATPMIAQDRCVGHPPFPDLGVQLDCRNCTINIRPGGREVSFGTEPRVTAVRADGPAEGRLRRGDVVVAIGGAPITSEEGMERISALRTGRAVQLTVRRGSGTEQVTVVPDNRCKEEMFRTPEPPLPPRPPRTPTPAAAPLPPQPPLPPGTPRPGHAPTPVPAPPQPPVPPLPAPAPGQIPAPPLPPQPPAPPQLSQSWFGFGIECDRCEMRVRRDRWTFVFRDPPTVESVEPGTPAARAGLQRGDRLTHVDGLGLTTPAGWERFGGVRPGEQVTLTFQRDGRTRSARLLAGRRPERTPAPTTPRAAPQAQRLRYSGAVGDTQVEVRGAPVTVTRDPRTGELIIRSSDVTVRVRPD